MNSIEVAKEAAIRRNERESPILQGGIVALMDVLGALDWRDVSDRG